MLRAAPTCVLAGIVIAIVAGCAARSRPLIEPTLASPIHIEQVRQVLLDMREGTGIVTPERLWLTDGLPVYRSVRVSASRRLQDMLGADMVLAVSVESTRGLEAQFLLDPAPGGGIIDGTFGDDQGGDPRDSMRAQYGRLVEALPSLSGEATRAIIAIGIDYIVAVEWDSTHSVGVFHEASPTGVGVHTVERPIPTGIVFRDDDLVDLIRTRLAP